MRPALHPSHASARFDDLTALAASSCEAPLAFVSLAAQPAPHDCAFSSHVLAAGEPLVIPDAQQDLRFPGDPALRFYAGVPLRIGSGRAAGVLWIADRQPRTLTGGQLRSLELLARQAEALLALEEQVRRVHAQTEELARQLAHDLKGPLGTLQLWLDLAQSARDDEALLDEALEAMSSAGRQMQRLVHDIHDLARGGGRLQVRRQPVDLERLVTGLGEQFTLPLRARRCQLQVESALGGELLQVDPELVERLAANLLDNAVRHTRPGTTVRVRLQRVAPDEVELQVEDEGGGIAEEVRARLFEPLFESEVGARRSHGLGLAFCRLAAEAHGGRIWVEDLASKGSRFLVRLAA